MVSQYLQMAMDTGLIHGESVLLIDLSTCTRCDDCVRACADTHGGTPRFIREGSKYQQWSVPIACYQCSDPVCLVGCPTGAITRAIGTLEVTINPMTCIGCRNCVKRCPWGNIIEVPFSSPTLKKDIDLATKCDLCVGREGGSGVRADVPARLGDANLVQGPRRGRPDAFGMSRALPFRPKRPRWFQVTAVLSRGVVSIAFGVMLVARLVRRRRVGTHVRDAGRRCSCFSARSIRCAAA